MIRRFANLVDAVVRTNAYQRDGAGERRPALALKFAPVSPEEQAIQKDWLTNRYSLDSKVVIEQGDAMTHAWVGSLDAVATETYLDQPFSAPPSPAKLTEVRGNCNHIISEFLKNIAPQLDDGTPLCVAVPAWRDTKGNFTHLPLVKNLGKLGYKQITLQHVTSEQLLYYREDQVVARELLLLTKI